MAETTYPRKGTETSTPMHKMAVMMKQLIPVRGRKRLRYLTPIGTVGKQLIPVRGRKPNPREQLPRREETTYPRKGTETIQLYL